MGTGAGSGQRENMLVFCIDEKLLEFCCWFENKHGSDLDVHIVEKLFGGVVGFCLCFSR